MAELAARDPAERVELLIRMTERLTDLLERETELFETQRADQTRAFQAEKQQLANIYRKETARIAEDPARIASAPAERRAALAGATQGFNDALARNQVAGMAMRQVTEGIVRAVADEMVKTRGAAPGYGPAKSAPGDPTAITLNRSV